MVKNKKKHKATLQKNIRATNSSLKPQHLPQPIKPAQNIQHQKDFLNSYELPSSYGTTSLVLMVKGPFWIYAYWEIAPSSIKALKLNQQEINEAKTVLRIYDITCIDFNGINANSYFDLEVGSANNWYINLWRDNVSFVGEIGLRTASSCFFGLARSNCVHTPRLGYSPRSEWIWLKPAMGQAAFSQAYTIARPQRQVKKPERTVSASKPLSQQYQRTIYLSEDDIRRYYSNLSPLLREVISARIGGDFGRKLKYLLALEGESEQERNKILARLPKDYFILGASQNLVFLGASESVQDKKDKKQRKFFFELAAELIVSGHTEPNATLELNGRKIELKEDGTFNLRFSLPDSKIPLEFKATSCDKQQTRKINTQIERKTKRQD